MNKYLCKSVVHAHGIPVLPALVIGRQEVKQDLARVRARICATKGLEQFPLFVKPVNLGSSVGVSKAEDAQGLDAALAKVFQYDTEALVEPCVVNKLEVNVSVLSAEEPRASVVEIPVASGEVLSYEDKYLRGGGKKGKSGPQRLQGMAGLIRVIDPEDLDANIKASVIRYGLEAYRILGCAGVVRFDFMVDTDSDLLYFNELNPLPGSMAHYLWAKSRPPLLYTEMLNMTIENALQRKEQQSGLKRDLGFKALFS
jgi:D-alanine-D-alanine ligase